MCALKECRLSNKLVKGKQESKYSTALGISITIPEAPISRVHVTRRYRNLAEHTFLPLEYWASARIIHNPLATDRGTAYN